MAVSEKIEYATTMIVNEFVLVLIKEQEAGKSTLLEAGETLMGYSESEDSYNISKK